MKYFTPALYQRFNSTDDEIADAADRDWDAAQAKYEQRLRAIRGKFSPQVRELADKMCLHDGEILNVVAGQQETIVWVRKQNTLYVLRYETRRKTQSTAPITAPCFSTKLIRWLYDEVDVVGEAFVHRILLSNGSVLTIAFSEFEMSLLEVHPLGTQERLEQLAKKSTKKLGRGTSGVAIVNDDSLFHRAGLVSVESFAGGQSK